MDDEMVMTESTALYFVSLCGERRLYGVADSENNEWVQYEHNEIDTVNFRLVCDLRPNRNRVTVFQEGVGRIGFKNKDYTFMLPAGHTWCPCVCPWGLLYA